MGILRKMFYNKLLLTFLIILICGIYAPQFSLNFGFYEGRRFGYWEIHIQSIYETDADGTLFVPPGEMWIYRDKTTKKVIEDQYPIVDRNIGSSNYADVWHINYVEVDAETFEPNSVQSVSQITDDWVDSNEILNCPIVGEDDTLEGDPDFVDLITIWFNKFEIFCFNFHRGSTSVAPIIILVDSDDNPVAGQGVLVNTFPTLDNFTDLWWVQHVEVPDDYVVNSVQSYSQAIQEYGISSEPGRVVNCPVNFSDASIVFPSILLLSLLLL